MICWSKIIDIEKINNLTLTYYNVNDDLDGYKWKFLYKYRDLRLHGKSLKYLSKNLTRYKAENNFVVQSKQLNYFQICIQKNFRSFSKIFSIFPCSYYFLK